MNLNRYKSQLDHTLEYLKRADYLDWLKAYFVTNLLLGSMPFVLFILSALLTPPGISFSQGLVAMLTVTLTNVAIVFAVSAILAILSVLGLRHIPRLFFAFMLMHGLAASIGLTIRGMSGTTLTFPFKGIACVLFFAFNALYIYGFIYCAIYFVIRNVKKREASA
jgi:hypothetical protein